MSLSKVIDDGNVYARREFEAGQVVLEKVDPHITHNAPPSVLSGTSLDITFTLVDFDSEERSDSGGTLSLDIDGAGVSLPITSGQATLAVDLFVSVTIEQKPPFFCDARMEPLSIEVLP